MRKAHIMLFCIVFCCVACWGCSGKTAQNTSSDPTPATAVSEKLVGVWVAYYELPFQGKTEAEFAGYISQMFGSIAELGANAVFCHVRPYCDSVYPSELFPFSNADDRSVPQGTDPGYDPMEVMLGEAQRLGLQFHAWINPYRVATAVSADIPACEALAKNHPVRVWMTDDDSSNDRYYSVYTTQSGGKTYNNISLNPAEPAVTRLIVDGVREILENYPVDGIHFDDYFYPTQDEEFDNVSFSDYRENGGQLSLGDWRRANVNAMVSAVYSTCRSYGKVFGISPAANISSDHTDRNYTHLYADIRLWAAQKGYVDYIMPQLYFGFDYPLEEYRFENLLEQWCSLERHTELKLYIGLAAYKIGTNDAGSDEWQTDTDILARQAEAALSQSDGTVLFSYGPLMSSDELNTQQKQTLKSILGRDTVERTVYY